jgi:cytochrome c oxidase assembly protein subunit 15
MKSFRRFALYTTIATYFLIFIGGLVRVSGAGMGCPDWPKCFGRWIPPTNISQLPADMDPTLFNFTLAWIEYFNRLVGVTIGFLILITAILAIKYYRKVDRVWIPSVAALILVAYQGWQGGQVVASQLQPLLVSAHLAIALIIAGLLIYATQQAYYLESPSADKEAVYPRRSKMWLIILWICGILQVILGTQVRSALEILEANFPTTPVAQLVTKIGVVNYVHSLLGILIAISTCYVGYIIFKQSRNISMLVREGARWMMILVLTQVALGLILMMAGVPAFMQLFHLWIASIYIGILFMLHAAFKKGVVDAV